MEQVVGIIVMVSQNEETGIFKIFYIFWTDSLFSRVQINTGLTCTLENGRAVQNMSRILKTYVISICETTEHTLSVDRTC